MTKKKEELKAKAVAVRPPVKQVAAAKPKTVKPVGKKPEVKELAEPIASFDGILVPKNKAHVHVMK
jgi:hypothetical protein